MALLARLLLVLLTMALAGPVPQAIGQAGFATEQAQDQAPRPEAGGACAPPLALPGGSAAPALPPQSPRLARRAAPRRVAPRPRPRRSPAQPRAPPAP